MVEAVLVHKPLKVSSFLQNPAVVGAGVGVPGLGLPRVSDAVSRLRICPFEEAGEGRIESILLTEC